MHRFKEIYSFFFCFSFCCAYSWLLNMSFPVFFLNFWYVYIHIYLYVYVCVAWVLPLVKHHCCLVAIFFGVVVFWIFFISEIRWLRSSSSGLFVKNYNGGHCADKEILRVCPWLFNFMYQVVFFFGIIDTFRFFQIETRSDRYVVSKSMAFRAFFRL